MNRSKTSAEQPTDQAEGSWPFLVLVLVPPAALAFIALLAVVVYSWFSSAPAAPKPPVTGAEFSNVAHTESKLVDEESKTDAVEPAPAEPAQPAAADIPPSAEPDKEIEPPEEKPAQAASGFAAGLQSLRPKPAGPELIPPPDPIPEAPDKQ